MNWAYTVTGGGIATEPAMLAHTCLLRKCSTLFSPSGLVYSPYTTFSIPSLFQIAWCMQTFIWLVSVNAANAVHPWWTFDRNGQSKCFRLSMIHLFSGWSFRAHKRVEGFSRFRSFPAISLDAFLIWHIISLNSSIFVPFSLSLWFYLYSFLCFSFPVSQTLYKGSWIK